MCLCVKVRTGTDIMPPPNPNPNHKPNLNVNPILTFILQPRLNPQTAPKSCQNVHNVPTL